jgi:hypothetical protein
MARVAALGANRIGSGLVLMLVLQLLEVLARDRTGCCRKWTDMIRHCTSLPSQVIWLRCSNFGPFFFAATLSFLCAISPKSLRTCQSPRHVRKGGEIEELWTLSSFSRLWRVSMYLRLFQTTKKRHLHLTKTFSDPRSLVVDI